MKKRQFAWMLAVVFVLAMTGCGQDSTGQASGQEESAVSSVEQVEVSRRQSIALGSSAYSIVASVDYQQGALTEEQKAEGMVAVYSSERHSVGFEIYEFENGSNKQDFEQFLTTEADAYYADEVDKEREVNGLTVGYYHYVEQGEDGDCDAYNYVMQDGDKCVELTFWVSNVTAQIEADSIVQTLTKEQREEDTQSIVLGKSPYTLQLAPAYVSGSVSDEEKADGKVGYYSCEERGVEFDVYQFIKEDGKTQLSEYIKQAAAEYDNAKVSDETAINDIAVGAYSYTEQGDEGESRVMVYTLVNGEEYVELTFYVTDEDGAAEAEHIVSTLGM